MYMNWSYRQKITLKRQFDGGREDPSGISCFTCITFYLYYIPRFWNPQCKDQRPIKVLEELRLKNFVKPDSTNVSFNYMEIQLT